ncbi:MAG TPA: YqiA/YcfP family alpha/beta fold hydrolase [Flavobacterium sp.]|jgi:hypothetical protein
MKILFLHGLESQLTDEKRKVLERYGEVIAPDLDYSSDSNMITTLHQKFGTENIDAIIGSSMGGFTGFYLALQLEKPALLFNPALPYRSVVQNVPEDTGEIKKPVHVVLGKLDPIIKYSDTKDFLRQHHMDDIVTVTLREDLEHRIPLYIFEEETDAFFKNKI